MNFIIMIVYTIGYIQNSKKLKLDFSLMHGHVTVFGTAHAIITNRNRDIREIVTVQDDIAQRTI